MRKEILAKYTAWMNKRGTLSKWSPHSYFIQHPSVDGVICLGCVIKGETKHDEYISNAVAQGLTQVGLNTASALSRNTTHTMSLPICLFLLTYN